MLLQLRLLDGSSIAVTVDAKATAAGAKARIAGDVFGAPALAARLRLVWNGQVLPDGACLADAGIASGTAVTLFLGDGTPLPAPLATAAISPPPSAARPDDDVALLDALAGITTGPAIGGTGRPAAGGSVHKPLLPACPPPASVRVLYPAGAIQTIAVRADSTVAWLQAALAADSGLPPHLQALWRTTVGADNRPLPPSASVPPPHDVFAAASDPGAPLATLPWSSAAPAAPPPTDDDSWLLGGIPPASHSLYATVPAGVGAGEPLFVLTHRGAAVPSAAPTHVSLLAPQSIVTAIPLPGAGGPARPGAAPQGDAGDAAEFDKTSARSTGGAARSNAQAAAPSASARNTGVGVLTAPAGTAGALVAALPLAASEYDDPAPLPPAAGGGVAEASDPALTTIVIAESAQRAAWRVPPSVGHGLLLSDPYGNDATTGRLSAWCPACRVANAHMVPIATCAVCGDDDGAAGVDGGSVVIVRGRMPPSNSPLASAAASSAGGGLAGRGGYTYSDLARVVVACMRCGCTGGARIRFRCNAVTVGGRVYVSRWDVPADAAAAHAVARLGAASDGASADAAVIRVCPSWGGGGGAGGGGCTATEGALGAVHAAGATPSVPAPAGGDLRVGMGVGAGVYGSEELTLAHDIVALLAAGPGL